MAAEHRSTSTLTVQRLGDGLWTWQVPHPDWTPATGARADGWPRLVSSVYHEAPSHVLLVDPQLPSDPDDHSRFLLHLDMDLERVGLPLVVALTCRWHVRSAAELRGRYGCPVVAADADGTHLDGVVTDRYAEFEIAGVDPIPTGAPGQAEVVIHLQAPNVLVVGDVIVGTAAGRLRWAPPSWVDDGADLDAIADGRRALVRRLAAIDIHRVLVSHILADDSGQPPPPDGGSHVVLIPGGRVDLPA